MTGFSRWLERRTSPAARLLSCVVLVGATALLPLDAHASLAVAGFLATALYALASAPSSRGAGARGTTRRLLLAYAAVLASVVPMAFANPLDTTLLRVARAAVCVTFAVAFAALLPRSELGAALVALGAPRGMADTVATLLRQLGALVHVGERLVLARSLRRATGVAAMVGVLPSLLLCGVRRAERVELAMKLRGSASGVTNRQARLRPRDAWLLAVVATIAVSLHAFASGNALLAAPGRTASSDWAASDASYAKMVDSERP